MLGHARDDESLATIARIDALGRGDGPPSEPVRINSMTLREITYGLAARPSNVQGQPAA